MTAGFKQFHQNKAAGQSYDLETLMRTYGNDVLRTAYLYIKDMHMAEDIFQEVFLKVNMNLDKFRGESNIKTWLIRITINCCKDYLKSAYSKRVVPMMDFKEDSLTSDDDYEQIEKEDRDKSIKEAVMELPDNYKDVVLCVYYQNMSIAETARYLDIAEGTVKSRLSRAKEKLKESIERRGGNEF